jgi:hypothetical protein
MDFPRLQPASSRPPEPASCVLRSTGRAHDCPTRPSPAISGQRSFLRQRPLFHHGEHKEPRSATEFFVLNAWKSTASKLPVPDSDHCRTSRAVHNSPWPSVVLRELRVEKRTIRQHDPCRGSDVRHIAEIPLQLRHIPPLSERTKHLDVDCEKLNRMVVARAGP